MAMITMKIIKLGATAAALMALTGCHVDMWRQNKVRPQQISEFFPDHQASRLPAAHTVPAKSDVITHDVDLKVDNPLYQGFRDGKLVDTVPIQVTKDVLLRGQERFNIFCTPCHGKLGDGRGMIALRGLALKRPPASYHTDRLRKMPIGHFYDVITNGYGIMYSYASRIQDPRDRWAIAAYVRALQLSQNATPVDVPPGAKQAPDAAGTPETGGAREQ